MATMVIARRPAPLWRRYAHRSRHYRRPDGIGPAAFVTMVTTACAAVLALILAVFS